MVHTHPALTYFLALIHSAKSHSIKTTLTAAIIASLIAGMLLLDHGEGKSSTELITERRMIAAMTLLRPESLMSVQGIAER